jgi:hypothetical protein
VANTNITQGHLLKLPSWFYAASYSSSKSSFTVSKLRFFFLIFLV